MIQKIQKPTSATVIAGMIDDKVTVNYGLFTNYYFIVDINRVKYGVKTTKEIYSMEKYRKNSTLDYSLYTYLDGEKYTLYRFCIPDLKFKAERGNLQ